MQIKIILSIFLISLSFSLAQEPLQDSGNIYQQSESDTLKRKSSSRTKRVFYSLILPGAGQWSLGYKGRAKFFIGAEFINEPASSGLENRVEMNVIGAMNAQAALKYLRQVKKAAVVTGGDRVDLALAALDQDVSCLILTGFMQPDNVVITAANDKKIPILLSPSDTYTTMRNLERLRPGIQEDEMEKVLQLIEKEINWEILL